MFPYICIHEVVDHLLFYIRKIAIWPFLDFFSILLHTNVVLSVVATIALVCLWLPTVLFKFSIMFFHINLSYCCSKAPYRIESGPFCRFLWNVVHTFSECHSHVIDLNYRTETTHFGTFIINLKFSQDIVCMYFKALTYYIQRNVAETIKRIGSRCRCWTVSGKTCGNGALKVVWGINEGWGDMKDARGGCVLHRAALYYSKCRWRWQIVVPVYCWEDAGRFGLAAALFEPSQWQASWWII